MIRADWTPLWAADGCTRKRLGPAQERCLMMLRNFGPLTWAQLRTGGISRQVLDSLVLSFRGNYPRLVDFDGGEVRRYCLAAPSQQAELDRALAVLRSHPEGITWEDLAKACGPDRSWGDVVVWHIYGAGLARYPWDGELMFPAGPGEQESLMLPEARKTAKAMTVAPQIPEPVVSATSL